MYIGMYVCAYVYVRKGHIGALLKSIAQVNFEEWMERRNEDASKEASKKASKEAGQPVEVEVLNWELWESNRMTQCQKRVMVTYIFGEAYQSLVSDKYQFARKAAFLRTGLLATTGTHHDDSVFFEGRQDRSERERATKRDRD